MKAVLTGLVIVLALGTLVTMQTYASSPGFGTKKMVEKFYADSPRCYGLPIPLPLGAVYADATGWSVCLGWLDRR